MTYDFDTPIERRGTGSAKWEYGEMAARRDLLPLWVADMDYAVAPEIQEAIRERAAHPVYGYTILGSSYLEAVREWMLRRHRWRVEDDWIAACPGVVPAVGAAIQAFTDPGDRVVVQTPAYYPFLTMVPRAGRELVCSNLLLNGSGYTMDTEHLDSVLEEGGDRSRMVILCSPHNPVGRVWRRQELGELLEICIRHSVTVISDEIHHDLVFEGHLHHPLASLSEDSAGCVVTCTSASKTFNLAGLSLANVIVPDPALRRRFRSTMSTLGLGMGAQNVFGLTATEAAYRHGEAWLGEVLGYIGANYRLLVRTLERELPQVRCFPLEGTYLAWLDCRPLGFDDAELKRKLLAEAGVWLDDGPMFGSGGEGFQRINIACPRSLLMTALERMISALSSSRTRRPR